MYSTYNAIQMIHTLHNNTDVLIGTDECTQLYMYTSAL